MTRPFLIGDKVGLSSLSRRKYVMDTPATVTIRPGGDTRLPALLVVPIMAAMADAAEGN
jgi:hypothetical protein